MTDVIFLVVIVAFFALCVAYIRAVRPDHRPRRRRDSIEEASDADAEAIVVGKVA